jgi:hypothetical protein
MSNLPEPDFPESGAIPFHIAFSRPANQMGLPLRDVLCRHGRAGYCVQFSQAQYHMGLKQTDEYF